MIRGIGLRGAIAINVITMIGIGPLITIPLVLAHLPGMLALGAWLLGAGIALCDGLVWAELSSRYPGSGGTYVFLREAFGAGELGRAAAFLFNWQFLLYAPLLLASGYIGFADYAAYLVPAIGASPMLHFAVCIACGVVCIAALYRRVDRIAAMSVVLGLLAVGTLLVTIAASLPAARLARWGDFSGAALPHGLGIFAAIGAALYVTLYDYAGYADVALLGDEVRNATRTIPRAIVTSVVLVAGLYVALQLGVLAAVPWKALIDPHAPVSQYLASVIAQSAWGHGAAVIVTLLVLLTAFASVYGNLLGFARIPFAAARDGAFFSIFGRVDPRTSCPHVALLAIGIVSLIASYFTLDQVIAVLTAGIVLVQGILQVVAVCVLRARLGRAPYAMPFFPLPALVAASGWLVAFVCTGAYAIAFGVAWLGAGALAFLVTARARRWWPFALAAALVVSVLIAPAAARAGEGWGTSRIVNDRGHAVFEVDGRPFFVYGAAFFYERIPREQWSYWLTRYRTELHVNTIDLYVPWNWHELSDGDFDFTGRTDPRRDLEGLLRAIHAAGLKIILRPGPVIRNEWRNGGYPAWLLQRPEYDMPLHDILEGRYPATATLQNAHADAAAAQWLANPTHLTYASRWLARVFAEFAPVAHDVIAIALDDDQGAYIDNDTWPAPHWRTYIEWLATTVRTGVGARVPLFINTYQQKETADSPVWAWGNWYQSDAYRIGDHDLAQIDLSTLMVGSQTRVPAMVSEFQAGWLQGADEARPRPADPSNTTLALHRFLQLGVHGIVNFPVQDTWNPAGWEAPWANASYAWDAAFGSNGTRQPRFFPTQAFGELIAERGSWLATLHPRFDVAIAWTLGAYDPASISNADVAAIAATTTGALAQCRAANVRCSIFDLRFGDPAELDGISALVVPDGGGRVLLPQARAQIARIMARTRIFPSIETALDAVAALHEPRDSALLVDDAQTHGAIDIINPSAQPRVVTGRWVNLGRARTYLPSLTVPPRGAVFRILAAPHSQAFVESALAPPAPLAPERHTVRLRGANLMLALSPRAGARAFAFVDPALTPAFNVATSIGLFRDGVSAPPAPSARDYIAAYTHPLDAGTFNRAYACTQPAPQRVSCIYDAPDLPFGGARFSRTLALAPDGSSIDADLQMTPRDERSTEQLVDISGFARAENDVLLTDTPHTCTLGDTQSLDSPLGFGIFYPSRHRALLVTWAVGALAREEIRCTRGAAIVQFTFARASAHVHVALAAATNVTEAQALLQSKRP